MSAGSSGTRPLLCSCPSLVGVASGARRFSPRLSPRLLAFLGAAAALAIIAAFVLGITALVSYDAKKGEGGRWEKRIKI